ncbi:MAG TPA: methyltransferase [Marmoricola sp.]|nr:methyltransferase [Marmoricola sp.]
MPDLIPRLRDALVAADYSVDAVTDLLGTVAHAALGRHETTPGLRATTGGSPLETLVRLWLLQTSAPAADVERALPGLLDELCVAGILERSAHEVAARVDLRPHASDEGDLWVASDLTPGLDGASQRLGADHVLGISPAATSLIELTVRDPVARALDLGTGCGVQALHLARHVERVVATDVNQRALWLAGINAELNQVADIELREGSLFEPVGAERFDLIVSNPPFVISPATDDRLVYRDSGVPGDGVVEQIVRSIPDHLAPGGIGQVLANWMIVRDQPWDERLAAWTEATTAWVVQREVLDPAAYVELWLKDAGLHGTHDYQARYDGWLAWFEEQRVEGIGFGWINLKATGTGSSRFEEWRWEVEQPLGPEVAAHFVRTGLLAALSDDALLLARPRLRADVVQETHGPVGAEHPSRIVLRQQRGMRRARDVDTALAGLAGASDGDLTVGQLLAALDHLIGPESVAGARLRGVRDLVADGFLELE